MPLSFCSVPTSSRCILKVPPVTVRMGKPRLREASHRSRVTQHTKLRASAVFQRHTLHGASALRALRPLHPLFPTPGALLGSDELTYPPESSSPVLLSRQMSREVPCCPPVSCPPPALRCICCPVCHPHKTLSLQHLPPSWQSVLRTGACRTRLKAWPKCHLLQDALLGPDQREAFLSTRNSIGPPLNNPTPLGSALLRRISSCLLACLLPVLPKKTSGPGPEQSLVHARYSRKKTVPRAQQGCRGAGRALRLAGAVRTDLASHLSPPQTFELEGPGCPPNLTLM